MQPAQVKPDHQDVTQPPQVDEPTDGQGDGPPEFGFSSERAASPGISELEARLDNLTRALQTIASQEMAADGAGPGPVPRWLEIAGNRLNALKGLPAKWAWRVRAGTAHQSQPAERRDGETSLPMAGLSHQLALAEEELQGLQERRSRTPSLRKARSRRPTSQRKGNPLTVPWIR